MLFPKKYDKYDQESLEQGYMFACQKIIDMSNAYKKDYLIADNESDLKIPQRS